MARLRHIARLMVPWWLFVEDGQKIVETFALLTDVYRQKLRSGLEARFPTRAGESAAALIGKYRLIPRGRDETLSHYAQRLKAWRYPRGHRVRGSAFSLLTQVYHYWGGVACWVHDRNQNKRAIDVDETPSYEYGVAWTWDGGVASEWARFWVVLDSTYAAQPDTSDVYLRWTWPAGATYTTTVTSWVDSEQSVALTQSGNDEPAYGERGPVFDGADDHLAGSAGSIPDALHQEATFFIVGTRSNDTVGTQELFRTAPLSVANTGFNIAVSGNAAWLSVYNGGASAFLSVAQSDAGLASGPFCLVAGFDATEGFVEVNGRNRATAATVGTASTGAATGSFYLSAPSIDFAGTIYEIVTFDRKLTETEIAEWRAYLMAKHGIEHSSLFSAVGLSGTIGIGGSTPADWVAMRLLVDEQNQHRWAPAGTQPEWMVVSVDGAWPQPDATWEYWGVLDGSVVVPARYSGARYVALRSELKDYPGEADRAAAAVQAGVLGFADFEDYSDFSTLFATSTTTGSETEIVEAASSSLHHIYTTTDPFEAGRPAALAIKAQQGSGDRHLQLTLTSASNPSVSFDLSTGTVVAESGGASGYCSGVADANGFYTLILVCDGDAFTYLRLNLLNASYADTYLGDGSSSVVVQGPRPTVNILVGRDYEFPATITMPDGSSYAGDPTSFPATITLPDDGDTPA